MSYALYKTVNFGASNAGLATVGYTLLPGGSRITSGVAEVGTSTGVYGATATVGDAFAGAILWDTGEGGSTVYAADEINPTGFTFTSGNVNAHVMSFEASLDAGDIPSVAEIVDGVWNEPQSGHATAGTFGKRLDADVTSRAGSSELMAVAGGVDDLVLGVTVSTNNDKTGYTLNPTGATAVAAAVWDPANAPAGTPLSDIKDVVVEALTVDTYAQPTGAPAATSSLKDQIGWAAIMARNKITSPASGGSITLYADNGTTVVATSVHSDNGTLYTRNKFA